MIKLIAVVSVLLLLTVLPACVSAGEEPPATFQVSVTPSEVTDSAPGQRVVLLVTVADTSEGRGAGEPVALSVNAPGTDASVEPAEGVRPGSVGEVTVIPHEDLVPAAADGPALVAMQPEPLATIDVQITGTREGLTETATVSVGVGPNGEWPLADAEQVRDLFVSWLAANHPELGIGPDTQWVATVTKPHWLVVSYYLFFSDRWEMGVRWHIMIPPYNWAEIYLRERFVETQPSLGFKVDSRTDDPSAVYPVEVTEPVWR